MALPKVLLTSTNSNLEVTGDKLAGDGYHGYSDGLHSVAWSLNRFIGRIKIQASLATTPEDQDWCDLDLDDSGNGYIQYVEATSGTYNYNFTGNWVWVRAIVTRSHDESLTAANSGTVTRILYNY